MATATLTDLQEQTFSGSPRRVDRDAGIIFGVKTLGRESKNGRTYSDRAMKKAAEFYEGIEVNIDHPDRKNPGRERGIRESFGVLKNSTIRDDGVYNDLHYIRSHDLAEQIAERAERFPDKVGLSHNAQGKVVNRGGKQIVEDIERVRSVDIVTRPATNKSLFESEENDMSKQKTMTFSEVLKSIHSDSRAKKLLLEMEGDMVPAETEVAVEPEAPVEQKMEAAFVAAAVAVVEDPKIDAAETGKKVAKILKAKEDLMKKGDVTEEPKEEVIPSAGETSESVRIEKLEGQLALRDQRDSARELLESAGVETNRLNVNGLMGQETDADKKSFIESLPKRGRSASQGGFQRPSLSPPIDTLESNGGDSNVPEFSETKDVVAFLRGTSR